MHDASKKDIETHWFYNHLYSTIQSTIKQDALRKEGHPIPRSGKPKS
jgi:hypothetical protein